ncbi:pyrroline-5-carboxylate reductase [Undibacterium macrobrachii]|uniref:Pyrroline-5-carboxylate reductase n=1 Tax=Undibacterium macrobrachii TaxID=1119058 RepID=A0ABQ2XMJ2_9BURK|nr:pyrroline-5-carboxylate reductase [Undibacterium macrobrachii]GGX24360.1 pyrroline-5-carboxylate reductase [Undibacterium macrobrachii]
MQSNLRIAFIGGGNMAGALISGLVKKLAASTQIHVIDLNPESLQNLVTGYGVSTSLGMEQADSHLRGADLIVLAVKPQQLHTVAASLSPYIQSQIVLSVAAGIRAADLSRWLGGYQKIVRAMPNTPAMIGLGMSGLYAMDAVSESERNVAQNIMQAVGDTLWVEQEAMIDAVTAVSGSGPAYVFYFIEAMQEAAQQLGFDAAQARQLALATFQGAAQLAQQSDESVSILRERVTSKGGTTYAALCSMDASEVKPAIHQAVLAAAQRGKELGDEFGQN